VLYGALAGGVLHRLVGERIRRPAPVNDGGAGGDEKKKEAEEEEEEEEERPLTLAQELNVDPRLALVAYEGLLAAGVAALAVGQRTPPGRLHAVLGGLLIGGAQLASVALTGAVLGTSGSFEEAGTWILWGWDRARGKPGSGAKRPS